METPHSRPGGFDYGKSLEQTHRLCRAWSIDFPERARPTFPPKPGGLLAWGGTSRSDRFFWDTGAAEDPDRWPVVVFSQHAKHLGELPWRDLDMPLEEVLATIVHSGLLLSDDYFRGPLAPTVQRLPYALEAVQWTPPPRLPPKPAPDKGRLAALTDGTGLEALCRLAPPPDKPYLGEGTWEQLFETLGTRLPAEFVALAERYGYGDFAGWLRFSPPLSSAHYGLARYIGQSLATYTEMREEFPEDQPLAPWPDPGGFLPFADTTDGDEIGWLTLGEPDEWPVIVYPRHADQGPALEGDLTGIILAWLRGNFVSEGFVRLDPDDDDPLEKACFNAGQPAPATGRTH